MKKGLLAISAISAISMLAPMALYAQDAAGVDELRSQLRNQQAIQQAPAQAASATVQVPTIVIRNVSIPTNTNVVSASGSSNSGSVAQADAYKSNSYQTQPTTLVEDAPYQDSKASAVRKKRQNVEDQTENKIVEKLETERMKDEERRANKILTNMDTGDQTASGTAVIVTPAAQQTATAVVVAPVAVLVPAPQAAPVVIAAPSPIYKEVKEESHADIDDLKVKEHSGNRFYVGGMGGIGQYPGANNVRGKYAVGFTAGMAFPDRLILEAGYTYSRFDVDSTLGAGLDYPAFNTPYLTQMNQSNVSLGLKWQVLEARVRPVVGALLDYSHRSYTQTINGQSYNNNSYSNNGPTSNSFDAGFLLGVDVVLTDSVTVGLDWRYMMNLTTSSDNSASYGYGYGYGNGVASNTTPIEQLSYYVLGVNVRFAF